MASDDLIPSFMSLQPAGGRRIRLRAPAAAAPSRESLPQLSFNLQPLAEDLEPPPIIPPAATREPVLYTVRQLIQELRQHIELAYTGILNVEGELSNVRSAASGHLYFTLKDGDAQLPVVLFRKQAQLLGFKLRDGLAVEVRGRISVYETRGQLQLIAETLRPRGTGALQLAFEQLRDRLRAGGLFDRERTPLPAFPRCIGVVTSATGAAIQDIINVIRRRHSRLNLLVYPAVVQGPLCPAQVAAGIRYFNRHDVDLILIARGGGSLEDLAGFNDERLARTIAASRLPVVSAIGHEIDHTIADFVADLRAPTPSAAAELITAAQHRLEEHVRALERRVLRAGDYHVLSARQRLERLSAAHVLLRLRDTVTLRHQRIDDLRQRIVSAIERQQVRSHRAGLLRLTALEQRLRRHDPTLRLAVAKRRLAASTGSLQRLANSLPELRRATLRSATHRLQALSPLAVLQRGYALVYVEGGVNAGPTLLRSAADAVPGQSLHARLAHGSVDAIITQRQLTETPTR